MFFTIGMFIASMVASFVASSLIKPSLPGLDDSGIDLQNSGADEFQPLVYGTTRVTGVNVFNEVADLNSNGQRVFWHPDGRPSASPEVSEGEYAGLVFTVACGPIQAFKNLYFDGKPLLRPGFNLNAVSGTIGYNDLHPSVRDHIQVQFNSGQQPSNFNMISALWPKWDTTCKGYNVASVAIKIVRDPFKGIFTNPNAPLEAEIDGKLISDIRLSTLTPTFYSPGTITGRNPAMCVLDYILSDEGLGATLADVDEYSFIAAANWCDAEKFYCDGVINQKDNKIQNLEALCSSFMGTVVHTEGKYRLVTYAPAPVDSVINEDDIISGIDVTYGSSVETFNRIEATFLRPENDYQSDVVAYPPNNDHPAILADGKVISKTTDYRFTKTKAALDKLASLAFETSQKLKAIKFTGSDRVYALSVNDIVDFTYRELGIVNQKYRVVEITRDTSTEKFGQAQVVLMEYNQAVFDRVWVGNLPPVNPPRLPTVPAPSNLQFQVKEVAETYTGCLTWNPSNYGDLQYYAVDYKLNSATEAQWTSLGTVQSNEMYIYDLHGAYYDFRVYAVDKFGRRSAFATKYGVDIKDDSVLPTPTGLKLLTSKADKTIADTPDFNLQWDSMDTAIVRSDSQFNPSAVGTVPFSKIKKGYKVQVYKNSVLVSTHFTNTPDFTYSFTKNASEGLNRNVEFRVYLVSKGGASSQTPAVLQAQNPQHNQPTGVKISGTTSGIVLKWDINSENDYSGSVVFMSQTQGFVPSVATRVFRGTVDNYFVPRKDKGTYYFRVANFDVFGEDNLVYSPEYMGKNLYWEDLVTDLSSPVMAPVMAEMAAKDGVNATAIATLKSATESQYVIKANANGYCAGIGLFANSAQATADIVFSATRMMFTNDNGASKFPLMELRNGNTYIRNAFIDELDANNIKAGSITADCIAANTITANKIATGLITANSAIIQDGAITNAKIGNVIQSANFQSAGSNVAPVAGWQIDKSGTMYAANLYASGTISGAMLRGCVMETANMIIEGGNNNILQATEADGWGGARYLCRSGAGIACSYTNPSPTPYVYNNYLFNTVAQSSIHYVKPYNYNAEGFSSNAGQSIANNYDRMKKRLIAPKVVAEMDVVKTTLDLNNIAVELWLCDVNGSGLGYWGYTFTGIPSGQSRNSTSNYPYISTAGYPTTLTADVNGYRCVLTLNWGTENSTSYSGGGGDHTSVTTYYTTLVLTSYTVTMTKLAGVFPYEGNQPGLKFQFQSTTNLHGSSWGADWYATNRLSLRSFTVSDSNNNY